MQVKFIEESFPYDGSQLRSLFAYLEYGLLGDSLIGWIGPCEIATDKIVDGEDLLAGSEICGSQMLHVIVEKFNVNLFSGVCLQRLMASIVKDLLTQDYGVNAKSLVRKGDDLFYKNGKLNISIATQSPSSTLVHFAINISNEGTPVKTSALSDFEIEPTEFFNQFANRFQQEVLSIQKATMKVRWVN